MLRSLGSRPGARKWLLAGGAVLFVAITLSAIAALPDESRSARPEVIVLLVALVPTTVLLNGEEYRVMARSLGHDLSLGSALRVSVLATVANYLPAPGGAAVRTAALRRRGSSLRASVGINAAAGLSWLGTAAIASSVALVGHDDLRGRAVIVGVVGVVAIGASLVMLRRLGPGWQRRAIELVLVEAGLVVTVTARVWVALLAIGESASIGASIAISSSGVVAAAVGIFPAGLGIREALAGGIAAAVDVPAAFAVAASALDRVCGQVGLALTALAVGIRPRDLHSGPVAAAEEDAEIEPVPPPPDATVT